MSVVVIPNLFTRVSEFRLDDDDYDDDIGNDIESLFMYRSIRPNL